MQIDRVLFGQRVLHRPAGAVRREHRDAGVRAHGDARSGDQRADARSARAARRIAGQLFAEALVLSSLAAAHRPDAASSYALRLGEAHRSRQRRAGR